MDQLSAPCKLAGTQGKRLACPPLARALRTGGFAGEDHSQSASWGWMCPVCVRLSWFGTCGTQPPNPERSPVCSSPARRRVCPPGHWLGLSSIVPSHSQGRTCQSQAHKTCKSAQAEAPKPVSQLCWWPAPATFEEGTRTTLTGSWGLTQALNKRLAELRQRGAGFWPGPRPGLIKGHSLPVLRAPI